MKNTVQSMIWLSMEVAPLTKKKQKENWYLTRYKTKAPQILTSENVQHQDIYMEYRDVNRF